jgi:hypothetical protein
MESLEEHKRLLHQTGTLVSGELLGAVEKLLQRHAVPPAGRDNFVADLENSTWN